MPDNTYVMFAAVNINDPYRGPVNVNWHARSVRQETGREYDPTNPDNGWKMATQCGWRVRRCNVLVNR